MKAKSLDDLKWVRVFSPVHIPKYLVEQIRDRDYTVEDFYKYQEINCLIKKSEGPTLNPFNHLYVLVDPENVVKGFLWFVIDSLSKDAIINTFSIDKEYWGLGKAMRKVEEHVKELLKKLKLKKVFWLTNYAKHSQRYGFKRSKSVLMEYKEKEDGTHITRGHEEARGHTATEPRAATAI